MATEGIDAVFVTTHNWGATAKFFQSLGYDLDFATDHNSGQFSNRIGPSVFVSEVPEDSALGVRLVLKATDETDPAVEVVTPFTDTHYGTREMEVRDPDGRLWTIQAPGKE